MPLQSYKPAKIDNKSVKRILSAALELWTKNGYHGASLKDIAERADVAKSLVHYHFASKEHLLIELQVVYSRRIAAEIRARLATEAPSIHAGLQAMDQVWDAIVAMRQQFPFALEVWRASLSNDAVRQRLQACERELGELFHAGVLATLGPLAAQLRIPPPRLAEVLQVAMAGLELHLFITRDVERVRRVYEDWKSMVRLALLPGGRQ